MIDLFEPLLETAEIQLPFPPGIKFPPQALNSTYTFSLRLVLHGHVARPVNGRGS